jgi:thioredoxin 1
MKLLETQADFEKLWFYNDDTNECDLCWIVYFTASWCKACRKLDIDTIQAAADSKNIVFYTCNETQNDYTAGYCGIKSFPTFVFFKPKTIVSSIQSSDTTQVIEWIQQLQPHTITE